MDFSLLSLGQIPTEMVPQPNAAGELNLDVANLLGNGEAISSDWIASLQQFMTPAILPIGLQNVTQGTPAPSPTFSKSADGVTDSDDSSFDQVSIDITSLLASLQVPTAFGQPVGFAAPQDTVDSPVLRAVPFPDSSKPIHIDTGSFPAQSAPVAPEAGKGLSLPQTSAPTTEAPMNAEHAVGASSEQPAEKPKGNKQQATAIGEAPVAKLSQIEVKLPVAPINSAPPEKVEGEGPARPATPAALSSQPTSPQQHEPVGPAISPSLPTTEASPEIREFETQLQSLEVTGIDWTTESAVTRVKVADAPIPAFETPVTEVEAPIVASSPAPKALLFVPETSSASIPSSTPATVAAPLVSSAPQIGIVPLTSPATTVESSIKTEVAEIVPIPATLIKTENVQIERDDVVAPSATNEPRAEFQVPAAREVSLVSTAPVLSPAEHRTVNDAKLNQTVDLSSRVESPESGTLKAAFPQIEAQATPTAGKQATEIAQQPVNALVETKFESVEANALEETKKKLEPVAPAEDKELAASPLQSPQIESPQIESNVLKPSAPSADPKGKKLDTEQLMRQVIDRVETIAQYGKSGSVTIHLDPKELGPLTLTVRSFGQRVDADIQTQNADVRAALQDNRQHLNQAIESRGLSLGSMQISHQDQGRGQQQQNLQQHDFEQFQNLRQATEQELPKPKILNRPTTAAAGVDLTV